jgi:hypothetical protein
MGATLLIFIDFTSLRESPGAIRQEGCGLRLPYSLCFWKRKEGRPQIPLMLCWQAETGPSTHAC